jgi:DNA gyrase/topoisomerase IV subunit B
MNNHLIELAFENTSISNVKCERPYTDLQAHQIIENISALDEQLMSLRRRGIDADRIFRDWFVDGTGTLLYRVKTSRGEYYKFEGEQFDIEIESEEEPEEEAPEQLDMLEEKPEDIEAEEENEVIIEEASDLPEIKEIKQILEKLSKREITPQELYDSNNGREKWESWEEWEDETPEDKKEKEADLLFKIEEKDGSITSASSARELLDKILGIGKHGINVQRYKGLSEMNSEQLRVTTMDPAVRTLIQVRLEDVVEADQMFTILMGSKVEPRKEFIEKYALQVTNLDIYGS